MKVDLTEVIEAIDSADDLAEYVYYIPYEEIMMRQGTHYIGADLPEDFDETAEPSDFIALPTRREINDYENMEKFADQYEDDDIAQWLVNSLKGKGAFRRFRAVLERFTIEDEWYDFLELQHKVKAMEWCEEHGIEYHDDTLRFEKHTEVTAAKTQSSLRLIPVNDDNYLNLVFMAADFRAAMAKGRGRKAKSNPDEAQYDLEDLMDEGCTLYAVGDHGRFIGYMVLKDDGFTVSLTELYVQPDRRRGGVASMLFKQAEKEAEEHQSELNVRVPYGNKPMLELLSKYGYATLEPLSIRKTVKDDQGSAEIRIGDTTLKL